MGGGHGHQTTLTAAGKGRLLHSELMRHDKDPETAGPRARQGRPADEAVPMKRCTVLTRRTLGLGRLWWGQSIKGAGGTYCTVRSPCFARFLPPQRPPHLPLTAPTTYPLPCPPFVVPDLRAPDWQPEACNRRTRRDSRPCPAKTKGLNIAVHAPNDL